MILENFNLQLEQNVEVPNYLVDINEDTVDESPYEPTLEGAMMHILEAEENWNAFQQAVALTELKGFTESGDVDYVLEAEQSEGFFTKAINWMRSMFGKVVQTFKKFVNYITSKVASDKHFIKKFEQSKLVVPSGFTFKGFRFNIDAVKIDARGNAIDTVIAKYFPLQKGSLKQADNIIGTLEKYNSNKGACMDEMRAASIGVPGQVSAKEAKLELKKMFRSGKTQPESISVSQNDLSSYIKIVKSHKESVDAAKTSMDKIKEQINKAIDNIKGWKSDIKNIEDKKAKSAAMSYINAHISALKSKATLLSMVNGALISALNQQNSQAKSLVYAVNAVQEKKKGDSKQEKTNESFSFLDNVNFI